tara:strand:- start:909 stop:1718 length:810 start_codon:yes stop_codon:yes gene_type:complete
LIKIERLKKELRKHEGDKNGKPVLVPYYLEYTDKETGKLIKEEFQTVGYGHKLLPGEEIPEFKNKKAAVKYFEKLLDKDINIAIADAKSLIGGDHPPKVLEGFTNMAFQLGKTNLSKFENTIKFIKAKDYTKASKEMLLNSDGDGLSAWASQTENRANEVSKLFKDSGFKGDIGETEIDVTGTPGDAAPQFDTPVEPRIETEEERRANDIKFLEEQNNKEEGFLEVSKIYDLRDNHANAIDKTNPDYDERLDSLGMDEMNNQYREEEIA